MLAIKLDLIIAERRSEFHAILLDVFAGISGITIVDVGPAELSEMADLDAELMPSVVAHERYGGRLRMGEAQILPVVGEGRKSSWVVTTVPMPAHLEQRALTNGKTETFIVKDYDLVPEEEAYFVYSRVFEAIQRFQMDHSSPALVKLGLTWEFLGLIAPNLRCEAEALRRAFVDLSH